MRPVTGEKHKNLPLRSQTSEEDRKETLQHLPESGLAGKPQTCAAFPAVTPLPKAFEPKPEVVPVPGATCIADGGT